LGRTSFIGSAATASAGGSLLALGASVFGAEVTGFVWEGLSLWVGISCPFFFLHQSGVRLAA